MSYRVRYRITRKKMTGIAHGEDKAKQWHFSLRDLLLASLGSAICLAGLRQTLGTEDVHWLVYVLFSLPAIGGMSGLLIKQFWGGVCGALIGATILILIREIV